MSEGRILIVDDEADVRKSVRLTLSKAGFEVIEAEDGEKAIEAIRSGDNPLKVDTIICDMQMPNIGGKEAIAFFRHEFPQVPVVVLTGKPDVQDASELFKGGLVDYLVKPVEPEKLTETIKRTTKVAHFKDPFQT